MGGNIYLHRVLGLSTISAMGATFYLQRGTLACSKIQHTFVLYLYPPGKGLPDSISLDESIPIILPGVHSKISSATSSLHFIAMYNFDSPVCQATPSDDIVFHDQFFQGIITRDLDYVPSSLLAYT